MEHQATSMSSEGRLPEEDDFVSSAVPEPSSIIVPLHRLPSSENEEFVSSPLLATSLSGGDDGFVPSVTPEPSSIIVPLYRLSALPTPADDGLVPSAVPESSTMLVPPATSAEKDGSVLSVGFESLQSLNRVSCY